MNKRNILPSEEVFFQASEEYSSVEVVRLAESIVVDYENRMDNRSLLSKIGEVSLNLVVNLGRAMESSGSCFGFSVLRAPND